MNRKSSTANPFLVGLLLLAAGVPCAFAQEPARLPTESHDMSPEANAPARSAGEGAVHSRPRATRSRTTPRPSSTSTARKHMNPNRPAFRRSSGAFACTTAAPTRRAPPGSSARRIRSNPASWPYGDLRVAADSYDSGTGGKKQSTVAARLNLDMDLALTATERIHAFTRPLDKGGRSRATTSAARSKTSSPTNSTSTSTRSSSKATSAQIAGGLTGQTDQIRSADRLRAGCRSSRRTASGSRMPSTARPSASRPRTSRRSTSATPTSPSSPARAQLTTDAAARLDEERRLRHGRIRRRCGRDTSSTATATSTPTTTT